MYLFACVLSFNYIHTYTHIYIHTYIHTYIEPIICEHHGRWGVTAIKLLKKLAHSAGESIPRVTHWQFRDFWVKAIGFSFQKNIAQTMVNNAQGWNRSSNLSQELKSAILGE